MHRFRRSLFLLCALGLAARCGPPQRPSETGAIEEWTRGPVCWLLLPEELREARRLRSNREAVAFIDNFWRRRDPEPLAPGNPFLQAFDERVVAADNLYSENGVRGSLTDRGRALVLLGSPTRLSVGQQAVPVWEPGSPGARPAVGTRKLAIESWRYSLGELPPRLAKRLLGEHGESGEILLAFAIEPDRTYLLEGEKILQTAAQAAVRESP